MATIHLLHGFVGAGKTTFAKKLERKLNAVRFTPDEWMSKLYGSNPPAKHFQKYLANIIDLIWLNSERLVALDIDVILDFGFWSRSSRDEARKKAEELGADIRLYYIVCKEDKMRRRVLKRTEQLPEGTLWINEAAIDLFKKRFEPLGKDEEHITIKTEKSV